VFCCNDEKSGEEGGQKVQERVPGQVNGAFRRMMGWDLVKDVVTAGCEGAALTAANRLSCPEFFPVIVHARQYALAAKAFALTQPDKLVFE